MLLCALARCRDGLVCSACCWGQLVLRWEWLGGAALLAACACTRLMASLACVRQSSRPATALCSRRLTRCGFRVPPRQGERLPIHWAAAKNAVEIFNKCVEVYPKGLEEKDGVSAG